MKSIILLALIVLAGCGGPEFVISTRHIPPHVEARRVCLPQTFVRPNGQILILPCMSTVVDSVYVPDTWEVITRDEDGNEWVRVLDREPAIGEQL